MRRFTHPHNGVVVTVQVSAQELRSLSSVDIERRLSAAVLAWPSGRTDSGPLTRWQRLLSAYAAAWHSHHALHGLLPAATAGGAPATVRSGPLICLLRVASAAEMAGMDSGRGGLSAAGPDAAAVVKVSGGVCWYSCLFWIQRAVVVQGLRAQTCGSVLLGV